MLITNAVPADEKRILTTPNAMSAGSPATQPKAMPTEATSSPAREWIDQGWAVLDPSGHVLEMDEALCRWLDQSGHALAGRPFAPLFKNQSAEWQSLIQEALDAPEPFKKIELQKGRPAAGSVQWFQFERVRTGSGAVARLASVFPPANELSEAAWDAHLGSPSARREMFVRLMRTETQLNSLMQRWPGVIFSQRPDCSFDFISPKIEEFTGAPARDWRYQPQLFWQVVHEADADEVQKNLRQSVRTPEGISTTFRIRHIKTGRVAYIMEHRQAVLSATGLLLGYDGYWLDITRQTIAEKRLSSSAWKETLAVLTMGLAHDFSNIMAGILSLSETFQAELGKDHPFYEGLTLIRDNSIQASQLIQRISQLHRGKPGERSYLDLNEMVTEMAALVRKIVPKRIKIETRLAPGQLAVYADAVEFQQVFVNLSLNAADAMPQHGSIIFETTRHESFAPAAHVQGVPPRMPAVCLCVRDTGCGIPARNLAAIFDPFFTTKEINKGSGLGLYNASLFVEKHQGAISVESKVQEGTAFNIWLPQADFTEGERGPKLIQCRHNLLLAGANGTALNSMAQLLRRNDFGVVVSTSSANAYELLISPDYKFSAVILQTTIGQSTLFQEMRRRDIPAKAILQIIGCNPDEIATSLIKRADLILPADTPEGEMLSRIKTLVETAPKSS